MLGGRSPDKKIVYTPEPLAAKHGAAVKERVESPRDAYADQDRTFKPVKAPWPGT
jgi:hypothetical protein